MDRAGVTVRMVTSDPPILTCQECGVELEADSPELRIDQIYDDEWVVYCADCWERQFGQSRPADGRSPRRWAILRRLAKRV